MADIECGSDGTTVRVPEIVQNISVGFDVDDIDTIVECGSDELKLTKDLDIFCGFFDSKNMKHPRPST